MDVLALGISRKRFDCCASCDRVYAGTQVCTGGRGCPVYEPVAKDSQRASEDRSYEVSRSKTQTKRSVLKAVGVFLGLCALSSCAGMPITTGCSDTDHVTRFTPEQIDKMSDEQVKQELARNEDLVRRGCASPNK